MSSLKKCLIAPVAALLLFTASQAHAELISWKYNWGPGALSIPADGGTGGNVAVTNEPTNSAVGSSDVVATNLRTISSAAPAMPDTLTKNGAYSLSIQIWDVASNTSGTLTFTGKLGGTFSNSNANVTNKFTGMLTQVLTLGGNTFTVAIGPYTPPGPPSASNAGSIAAHVDVEGGIHVTGVPEPSTMGLAIFGLTTVGAGWWRKRRLAA
jgi:hypothetical protein